MCKQIFVPLILGAAFLCSSCVKSTVPKETKAQVVNIETYTAELEATPVPFVTEIPEAGSQKMSENDIRLIALVTMAEAEGECEEGQRLVIDTILNRVDSVYFPDTVYDVVYQPYHFSSMWNGRAERCERGDLSAGQGRIGIENKLQCYVVCSWELSHLRSADVSSWQSLFFKL